MVIRFMGLTVGSPEAEVEGVKRRIEKIKRDKQRDENLKEFRLVRCFLVAFVFLLVAVLILPAQILTGTYENAGLKVAETKKEILAILIAAIGPWIAAGAAYFFGRENLREAYAGMKSLQPQEKSPDAILRATLIRDLPLRTIDFIVTPDDEFSMVKERFWTDQQRWFFIFVDHDGKFFAAIHEEEIWRIRAEPDQYPLPFAAKAELATQRIRSASYDAMPNDGPVQVKNQQHLDGVSMKHILRAIAVGRRATQRAASQASGGAQMKLQTLADLVARPEGNPNEVGDDIIKSLNGAEVFRETASAFVAEQVLQESRKYLGVVIDADGKPTGYFSTGDIRRVLTGAQ